MFFFFFFFLLFVTFFFSYSLTRISSPIRFINSLSLSLFFFPYLLEFATCQNLTCPISGHKCLTHPTTGHPQCANCDIVCPPGTSSPSAPTICATDGQTYANFCAMKRAGCAKSLVLETRHVGRCGGGAAAAAASSSSSSSPSTERKLISFPFSTLKSGRKAGLASSLGGKITKSKIKKFGLKNKSNNHSSKKAGALKQKKMSKKERRARRRMQRRQRLQAKAALLAQTQRKNGGVKGAAVGESALLSAGGGGGRGVKSKKFSSSRRGPTGAKPFKHPQSSLAVKRAAPLTSTSSSS